MSYASGMTMTADEILEHVRALPYAERLKLLERVAAEVEASPPPPPVKEMTATHGIWADVPDDEYEAFLEAIRQMRSQPWRVPG